MHRRREHAPSRKGVRRDRSVAAQIIGLKVLKVRDVIDFSAVGNAVRATGHAKVVRLLFVGGIPRSNVSADYERKASGGKIGLEGRQIHIFGGENRLLDRCDTWIP